MLTSTCLIYIVQDPEKLSKFLRWAVTTAIQSKSEEVLHPEDSEESLASKLLRWLIASAILGKISFQSRFINLGSSPERSSLHALLSWLGCLNKWDEEYVKYTCEDMLAASIIYLLQLLNFTHQLLPSAVSALCLLLLSESTAGLKPFHTYSNSTTSIFILLASITNCCLSNCLHFSRPEEFGRS